jgi:hypothetical protein
MYFTPERVKHVKVSACPAGAIENALHPMMSEELTKELDLL